MLLFSPHWAAVLLCGLQNLSKWRSTEAQVSFNLQGKRHQFFSLPQANANLALPKLSKLQKNCRPFITMVDFVMSSANTAPTEKRWEGCWSAYELRKRRKQILHFRCPISLLKTWPGPSIKWLAKRGFQRFNFYLLPGNSKTLKVFVDHLLQVCQKNQWMTTWSSGCTLENRYRHFSHVKDHQIPAPISPGDLAVPLRHKKPQISASSRLPLDAGSSPPRRLADATESCMVPRAPRRSYWPRAVSTNKQTGPEPHPRGIVPTHKHTGTTACPHKRQLTLHHSYCRSVLYNSTQ